MAADCVITAVTLVAVVIFGGSDVASAVQKPGTHSIVRCGSFQILLVPLLAAFHLTCPFPDWLATQLPI